MGEKQASSRILPVDVRRKELLDEVGGYEQTGEASMIAQVFFCRVNERISGLATGDLLINPFKNANCRRDRPHLFLG